MIDSVASGQQVSESLLHSWFFFLSLSPDPSAPQLREPEEDEFESTARRSVGISSARPVSRSLTNTHPSNSDGIHHGQQAASSATMRLVAAEPQGAPDEARPKVVTADEGQVVEEQQKDQKQSLDSSSAGSASTTAAASPEAAAARGGEQEQQQQPCEDEDDPGAEEEAEEGDFEDEGGDDEASAPPAPLPTSALPLPQHRANVTLQAPSSSSYHHHHQQQQQQQWLFQQQQQQVRCSREISRERERERKRGKGFS